MLDFANMQMRDAFITNLLNLAKDDKDIIFISNEYGAPALDAWREELPGQFINAGISEQNIISVAAGLALENKKVFVYSIASFITLRCFEQLKLDMCVHKAPITLLAVGCCFAYSEDGPTHHATEDIAVMRTLPGLTIHSPSEAAMAYELADLCVQQPAMRYIRFDKGKYPPLDTLMSKRDGTFSTLNTQDKTLIISTGIMTHRAIEVAQALKKIGHETNVVDLYQLKPLGTAFADLLKSADSVITIEEHTEIGGLGSIVAETMLENDSTARLKKFAVSENMLYTYGVRDKLHRKCGLDKESLTTSISSWLDKGKQ